MNVLEQKKVLVERILPYLTGAPDDVVQRLLQKHVSDLETILEDAITTKARTDADERVAQHAAAWTHACRALINDKRLSIIQSNRDLLESLLNPGEEPSAKLFIALAQQYPQRFAWSSLPTEQTDEERRAEFISICRQNNLSECDANAKLHQAGIGTEQWAGASQVELQEFRAEAALARQKWLVNDASPTELRAEARYETRTQLTASQQSQADASLQAQKERDQHLGFKPLPAHIDRKTLIKASKDELRRWSRLYGQFQLNSALRAQQ
jgi:hypothetical protein